MPEKKEDIMFGFEKRFAAWFAVIGVMVVLSSPAFADETEDLIGEISLGDLLNLELTTAGKKAEKMSDIPASAVVITREDIKTYGYRSLQEILENVPGIYVTDQRAPDDVSVNVRGFWSKQTTHVIPCGCKSAGEPSNCKRPERESQGFQPF